MNIMNDYIPDDEFEFNPGATGEQGFPTPLVDANVAAVVTIYKVYHQQRVYDKEWDAYLSPEQLKHLRKNGVVTIPVSSIRKGILLANKAKCTNGFSAFLDDPAYLTLPKYSLSLTESLLEPEEFITALQTALFTSVFQLKSVPFVTGSLNLLHSLYELAVEYRIEQKLVIQSCEAESCNMPFVNFIESLQRTAE